MTEYQIGKAVVRVHGEADQKRIEQACLAYLANTEKPTKTQNNEGGHKNGKQHYHH